MSAATDQNIVRKSEQADAVQLIAGKPLFSWLDLNVTELCNRRCDFCPRAGSYPNQRLSMSEAMARKIGEELATLHFSGTVVLSGFGEPLLHPQLSQLVGALSVGGRVELVTNGDFLTLPLIQELFQAGIKFFVVSLYDGIWQVARFQELFERAALGLGVHEPFWLLRDRWHGADSDFGLKLTNRAGAVVTGNQPAIDRARPCFYPAYSMMVDWNGDVLLCVQDWSKQVRWGNLHSNSLSNIWFGPVAKHWRDSLLVSGRQRFPCINCNANGQVHGGNHTALWTAS